MKIALVHDYLTQLGGAEKVLAGLQDIYPDSPVFVLVYNKNLLKQISKSDNIYATWLQFLPLSTHSKYYHWYLTLMPKAIESFKFDDFEVIVSSASSIGKGVRKGARTMHVCYCHTPTRYLWHDAEHYIEELGYNKLIKKIVSIFTPHLRNWDLLAAKEVDYFIANSHVVQKRIKKYYGRDSTVIYPPVATHKFHISSEIGDYYLIGGRLVAYKKYDLAIQAFNHLGIKLKIFGTGSEYKRLKKMALSNIEFLGNVNDQQKAELYSHCRAFIYPQIEDFGITAIEAMASGRPVIAFHSGGATETIIPGVTGEFFSEQIWESLAYTLLNFDYAAYDPHLIKAHASKFNVERFKREVKKFIESKYKNFQLEQVFRIK